MKSNDPSTPDNPPNPRNRINISGAPPQTVTQRDCPHCDGPVTIVALLTIPEAARPTTPIAAPDGVIPFRR